jgi:hypothetical protein
MFRERGMSTAYSRACHQACHQLTETRVVHAFCMPAGIHFDDNMGEQKKMCGEALNASDVLKLSRAVSGTTSQPSRHT